ncbi:MAG: MaoC family dehydratase [Bauldia sp.]
MRYFEDFTPGTVLTLAPRHVTRAEIIAFAAEFDPQPFHLDEQAPASALVGGLIASGWHVSALFMRMICDAFMVDSSSMGSPGITTLKWQKPVRPGDTLSGTCTVLEARRSKSRPEMGIVRFRHEVVNQSGEIVMWLENPILFAARDGGQP